jgi:hypothetical protein
MCLTVDPMRLFKFVLLALICICLGGSMRLHGGPPTGVTTFSRLNVGGGGFTSGIQISPDGLTAVARIDVFGTYVWNTSTLQWDLLDTTSRMPSIFSPTVTPGGGIEIVTCASNSSVIYKWMGGDGNLYRSLNRGTSFVQLTGFSTHDNGAANGATGIFSYGGRLGGYKMACDPANPDVLYVGTSAGVLVSTNASQGSGSTPTFSSATGITAPAVNGYGYNFAFDANGGTTGGKTNILYVASWGTGIFKMTTPGGSFSSVGGSGMPGGAAHMAVSPNGLLWTTDDSNTYKCASCSTSPTWTTYSSGTTGVSAHSITIDTNHSASSSTEHIILGSDGGLLSTTSNSGTSWSGSLSFTLSSATIPWLALPNPIYMSNGGMAYNAATDVIWFGEGIGVSTAPGNTSSTFVWTAATKGIESLEPQTVIASNNTTGQPALAAWDRPVFGISTIGTYPTSNGTTYAQSIVGGWGFDWATSDGSTLVALATWPNVSTTAAGNNSQPAYDVSSTSSDNGQTWTPFPISSSFASTNLTTTASAAAGTNLLTFTSVPAWVGRGATVSNTTHAGTVFAYVQGVNSTQILIDRPVTGAGVSNGDTIKVGFSGSGQAQAYATNASTSSGQILHFASVGAANNVHPAMLVYNLTNGGSLVNGMSVYGVSGGDVTLTSPISSTVASGDVILFTDTAYGGALAASSPSNICITPANNLPFPYCTTDSGATWNAISIAGVARPVSGSTTNASTSVIVSDSSNFTTGATVTDGWACIPAGATISAKPDATHLTISAAATCSQTFDYISPGPSTVGWSNAYSANMKNIAADRVTATKFYMYNYITGKIYACSGSCDVSANWASVNTTPSNIATTYSIIGGQNSVLKTVPGNAGHLFLTEANITFQNTALIRSTDGGVNWSAVANVTGVNAVGFGKPKPSGGGYPTIFISGQVSGVFSLWRSDDNCATWVNLGTYNPTGNLDSIIDLDGDKNLYGKVYGAFSFSGWFYGTLN